MKRTRLKNEDIGALCQGLALLLHAGVSTGDGLALLAEEEEPGSAYGTLLTELAAKVDTGMSLSAALQASECFPPYVYSLIETGERTGRTEEALQSLYRHYEDRARLSYQIRSALLYPAILLVIMLAVIVILLVRVLPVFNEVYAYMGGRLTGIAGGLLSLGQALDAAMPVLCILLGIIVLCLAVFALSPSFREKITGLWQKRDRGISRQLSTARFAQSLSMGLHSGLPVEEALSMASSLMDNNPSAQARCQDCLQRLEAGESLAAAMQATGLLPRSACRLLEIGLRSGSGDTAMAQIASRLSIESEEALEALVGRVEPALVMVTSVLVGLILLSVMLPLMNIMTAIG